MQSSKHMVYWPDGKLDKMPRDGEHFFANGDEYVWDGVLNHWYNKYTLKMVDFTPAGAPKITSFYFSSPDRADGEEMVSMSPTKCECGSEIAGSSVHSSWCQKYDKGKL